MNAVAPAVGAPAVFPNGGGAPAAGAHNAASLLPAPEQPVGSIESLYVLMAQASAQKQSQGKVEVEAKFLEKRAALEKVQAELKEAAEAKSGNVFKTLATVGVVLAAAVATAFTLGGAAPVLVGVGLAISAGGFLVGETKCLDFMGEGVSKWVGLGMAVCGAVMTCGAGGTTGAVQVIQSGSTIASGCQTVEDAVHTYRADEHRIEAKAAQHQMQRIQAVIDEVIAELEDDKDTSRRRSEAVNTIVETQGQTLLLAAGDRS